MDRAFRQSMSWLHTWAGVVFGSLLFAIFWMGTLAVFDREIDRWMAPMTRLALQETQRPWSALRTSLQAAAEAKSATWLMTFPVERRPVIEVIYRSGTNLISRHFDPSSGASWDPGTLAGSQFIYPFHVHLHLKFWDLGYWIVGLAAIAMLVLCISGVIIHRKIFADFFVFRPQRQSRRATLDLHNLTGVLGLPFHLAITLSGLIIFYAIYFPSGWRASYSDRQAFNADAYGTYARPRLNQIGGPVLLESIASESTRLWGEKNPRSLIVFHPGDAASYVAILRPSDKHVGAYNEIAYFDASTGALLHHQRNVLPVMTAQRFIVGFHMIQFRHWTLRWVYFALGLLGCVLIGTGYLFWLESRRKRHAQLGLSGVGIVEALTVASTTGIIAATFSFFIANRLLPSGATVLGQERAALEVWVFYFIWLLAFCHAWLRPGRAWAEQCWAIASLCVAAVALNWITTGDHLIRSLAHRHLWPVAGMDLMLLAGAAISAISAYKLRAFVSNACERPSSPQLTASLHKAE